MMKTAVTKPAEFIRKWYLVDGTGQVLGRLSTGIADILRGKNKPNFSAHIDCGDYVIVTNTRKIRFTGNKLEDKSYYRHSGYPGGIRKETLAEKMDKDPNEVLRNAVKGMLPKNKLSDEIIKKLKTYPDDKHKHEAQNPEKIKIGELYGRK